MGDNSSFWDFHCTDGGKWYACPEGSGSRFVGCCTSDPCGSTGCVQGDVRSAGYNATHHGEFPDASCGSASNFFTCGFGSTFWGCCKSDPCAAVPGPACKSGDLVPAFMERHEQFVSYTGAGKDNESGGSSSNTGAIAGGVVGGVAVVVIIGVAIFLYLRRRRRQTQKEQETARGEHAAAAATPMMGGEKPDERMSAQYGGQSPPPMYSTPAMGNQGFYQDGNHKQQYAHHHQYASFQDAPQELPAELASPNEHRFSELPTEASSSSANPRFSELPANSGEVAHRTAELESPQASPRPLQTEFQTDLAKNNQGLGVTTEEPTRKN